jgi:hypothetical protein
VGADGSGRALPLHLAGKHIEIEVASGATWKGWRKAKTKFKVTEIDTYGNKGKLLYEFDGIMKIWSGRMSSDASVSGIFKPITGEPRLQVAKQVIHCNAKNL